jgi:hypothetical protein
VTNPGTSADMSDEERRARALLAIAVAYDNRRPSEANITAWMEAADRAHWIFEDAREAIHTHYATSTDFLMPGHITAWIKANRRQPEAHKALAPAREPDPRVRALVAQVAAKLGWERKPQQARTDPAQSVDCPYCRAIAGRPCARLATRGPHRGEYVPLRAAHPSRIERAGDGA